MSFKTAIVIFRKPQYNYQTAINGKNTDEEIRQYFEQTIFNVGTESDNMQKCLKCIVIGSEERENGLNFEFQHNCGVKYTITAIDIEKACEYAQIILKSVWKAWKVTDSITVNNKYLVSIHADGNFYIL